MIFQHVYANDKVDRPRAGDRIIYDQKNGTLSLYRDDADLTFEVAGQQGAVGLFFVGRDWTPAYTQAVAEFFAKLGELDGEVARIEGSFPTLVSYEVVR